MKTACLPDAADQDMGHSPGSLRGKRAGEERAPDLVGDGSVGGFVLSVQCALVKYLREQTTELWWFLGSSFCLWTVLAGGDHFYHYVLARISRMLK